MLRRPPRRGRGGHVGGWSCPVHTPSETAITACYGHFRVARKSHQRTKASTPGNAARWIMFMPTIPAKPASVRVKIWRRLQAIGAINIRGAVYVLPNRDECMELFEWLGRELVGLGGQASLC